MLKSKHMLRVFFMITVLNTKTLYYPTLTGSEPNYLLNLVRLLQRKKTITECCHRQEQLELLIDAGEVTVERDEDEISEEKNDRQTESFLNSYRF